MRKLKIISILMAALVFLAAHATSDSATQQKSTSSERSAIEKTVTADISVESSYEHMSFLVEEVGERLAGTASVEKAANYIKDELQRYGLDARIDRFPMYHSYPVGAALRVLSPEERVIEAKPVCHIPSTLDQGVSGELIYARAGGYDDYENIEVEGKIVLTDMTWSPPRPEKARIAYEMKARALIIMNWGTSDNPVIQMGAVKSVWGNPTPDNFGDIPQIPVISVTRASGEYLKELCSESNVRVWLRAEATREWVQANQPIGVLNGQAGTDEFVLVGGHLEAWGKTAICNSSGNAQLLELARVFAKHRDKLERNIVFAFWDGHEIAEAAGSTYYVDTNWDELSKHCVAYVNIDNPGIIGTSVPKSRGVPEVRDFQLRVVKDVWGTEGDWSQAYKGGDESFLGVGVPYIGFATGYTAEELERLNWASLSPWLHSEADTIDKIDKGLYEKHLQFFATLILRLSNSKILPYNLSENSEALRSHLESLKKLSQGIDSIELDDLIAKAGQLEKSIHAFGIKEQQVRDEKEAAGLINEELIKVSRDLSHILWTEAGRYDQDPYGYYLVGKPIPKLYVPITRLRDLEEGDEEYNLWTTKFLRERNRVSDTITSTTERLMLTTKLLEKMSSK